jgi:phosphatidylethanolamine/phosphatidyl-N-methylethanolamine N-methyltransferase
MSIRSVYNGYAKFYDFLFSITFDDARKKAINNLTITEQTKVLEFGIGTGLSLKYFPKEFNGLTGIDLSEKMLKKCNSKANKLKMNVDLQIMDCENTTFENESFDYVILIYVYSVSQDPHKLLKEAFRVCKNSGSICIINHFSKVHSNNLNFF